jgi:hypothetical protein
MAKAMTKFLLGLALLAAPAVAAPAAAAPPAAPSDDVRIPFVARGGILRMEPAGEEALYIQDRHRDWYRATLNGPCYGLTRTLRIGFDTRGSSNFDRFSTILVGDERCQIQSLVASGPPPSKRSARKS